MTIPASASSFSEIDFERIAAGYGENAASVYEANRGGWLWLEDGRPGTLALEAIDILEQAPTHGLPAHQYSAAELRALGDRIAAGRSDLAAEYEGLLTRALLRLFRDLRPQYAQNTDDPHEHLVQALLGAVRSGTLHELYQRLIPQHEQYAALQSVLERLRTMPQPVQVGRGATLRLGDEGPRVAALRSRLLGEFQYHPSASAYFDSVLEQAVIRYQTLHGLTADGLVGRTTAQHMDMTPAQRLDRVRLALARWRELPVDLGDHFIHVNVPEYRLAMHRDGAEHLQMRVVVGSTDNPTPAFSDEMEYLVFNPYWFVPRRIALEELVPKAAQSTGYLTRNGYEVTRDGHLVDEAAVDWAAVTAANFDVRIRQRPGPGNALGAVKFLFPNDMNIYLHDSPARSLYRRDVRAFSHGCVRVEEPDRLAQAILELQGEQWNAQAVAQSLSSGKRRQVNLQQRLPVYLTYITARVTADGELAIFNDIYGRDAGMLARLL